MTVEASRTVGEIAAEMPAATRIFESVGIDYCCGGGRTLGEACRKAGVPLDTLAQKLAEAAQTATQAQQDWRTASLTDLVAYIVGKHHAYVRSETPRLQALIAKVAGVHGGNHPELPQVQHIFHGLSQELAMHMMKEEQILFPAVVRMEEARAHGLPAAPPMFGTVQNPIRVMVMEHDSAGEALADLHAATNEFAVPADACISYRTLYSALQEYEADLHEHIHLENNILFPRAVELEQKA